jgi:hypothetical protein
VSRCTADFLATVPVASRHGVIERRVAAEILAAVATGDQNGKELQLADREKVVNPISVLDFEV